MNSTDEFISTFQQWIEIFMRRSMRTLIRYSKDSGLSLSQIGALFRIYRTGVTDISDVGDHLGVTSAAASQMIDRLVQSQLILRTEDPRDRRVKQIFLTDKGRQALQDSMNARQSWLVELASALSIEEKEQVVAALNILIEKSGQIEKVSEVEK